ncbi:MAG: response regulator [Asticcacaulis sp.]
MADLSRVLALIVDDNHYMRTIVSAMLRSLGITNIREASDGAEAMEMVRDWRPDVILCDIVMEHLDGIEFTRLIRTASDSPHPYVPIIMITGHTDRDKVIAARDAGVNELIAKPLTARALIDRLKAVLDSDRPWVKSPVYTGPCRRRRKIVDYDGPRRRASDKNDQTLPEVNTEGDIDTVSV